MRSVLLGITLLAAATAHGDAERVMLWQAEGATNRVYLLGSIHLLREQDYPLPDVFETAYRDAEALVMEIDMDDLDPLAAQAEFTRAGKLPENQSLRDIMGAGDYARAEALAEDIGIPLHLMDRIEPWYAAITAEVLILGRLGFDARLGIESHLLEKALLDGKRIDGLETIAEQVAFLDGLSLPVQRQMLLSTLEEGAELDEVMDEVINAWRSGDTETMATELDESFGDFEELENAILVNRNRRWVEQLLELLDDEEDYLIVVGALHLVGDDGVPALLKQRGVSVRQMSESDR